MTTIKETPFVELGDECYICLLHCKTKSPCQCATVVHPKCLREFRVTSGHTACTICLDEYPLPQPRTNYPKKIMTVILAYLVCGLIGQFIWSIFEPITITPPWTVNYGCGALGIGVVLGFVWILKKN